MTDATYPCWRCDGKGTIQAFSHVIGGVCFKCHGTGRQKNKPATKGIRFAVFAPSTTTGKLKRTYNKKAKTPASAVKMAQVTFRGASAEFKAAYDMTNAIAIPESELSSWDVTEI